MMYACFATSHRGYVTMDDARRYLASFDKKHGQKATVVEMHTKLEGKVGSVLAEEGIQVTYSRGVLASEFWIALPPTPGENKATEAAQKGAESLAKATTEAKENVDEFAATLEKVGHVFDTPQATTEPPEEAVKLAEDSHPFTLSKIGNETEPFDDPDWYFESELAGVRAMLVFDSEVQGQQIQVLDEHHNDISVALPDITKQHRQFQVKSCILDGVLIAVAAGQVDLSSDFLEKCVVETDKEEIRKRVETVLVRFMAIDVLSVNGKDITETGKGYVLSQRKKALKKLFVKNDHMAILGFTKSDGLQRVELSSSLGYNVIAKKASSVYTHGKNADWMRVVKPTETTQEDATEPEVSDDYLVLGYTRKGVLVGKETGSIGYDYCGEIPGTSIEVTKEAGRALMTQIKDGRIDKNCFVVMDDKLPQIKGFCIGIPCTIEYDNIDAISGLLVNPRLIAFQSVMS